MGTVPRLRRRAGGSGDVAGGNMSTMTVSSIAHCEDCESNTALDIHGRCGKCGSEAVTRRTAMVSQADSLKAMNQAVCDGLRQMYVLGRLRESEVRKALTPDADLRHEYDEAMKLVFALTANVQRLREEND